ncbi:MAG: carbohydrate ABC transporter permease [Candidatus Limiplasma sp.]|nr:carbohydrate ABC transporter permease [Candidatus Limiplasma sp.]
MRKAFITVGLAIAAVVFLLPVFITFTSSFMGLTELTQLYEQHSVWMRLIPMKVTLNGYYELLFASGSYLSMFWNSMLVATAISVGNVFVALLVGYVLAKVPFRGRDSLRFMYIAMMMMPFQVTLLPNYIIVKQLGLYNTIWALILPGMFAPFGVFLLSQFLRGISDEMVEAAVLETNSPIQILVQVVAPMVYPGLLALFLLSFSEAWNMVEQPLILLQDSWRYPLSLVLNNVQGANLAVAFAGSVLYMLPVVLLYRMFEEELFQGLSVAKF